MTKTVFKTLLAICLLPWATFALAQADGMKDMEGTKMPMSASAPAKHVTHTAQGIVKAIDTQAGEVTVAHGPIKTLQWPAMTMAFKVRDKALFDKLAMGKQITFQIVSSGKDYVVIAVK